MIKRAPLPEGIDPMLIFADFDREGMIDILGYSPAKKAIYVFINGLIPRKNEEKGL